MRILLNKADEITAEELLKIQVVFFSFHPLVKNLGTFEGQINFLTGTLSAPENVSDERNIFGSS